MYQIPANLRHFPRRCDSECTPRPCSFTGDTGLSGTKILALTGSYWLLLALGPPETHPMSIQTFHKSLIVNKLPKHTLCLGTSESTQRQPRFCNLLIIKRPKTERWLWGGKYAGKLLFRSRRLECGEKSAGKIKFSFLRYLARQSFVRTLFLWPFRKRKCLVLKKVYLI